jgi:hypothetical protein
MPVRSSFLSPGKRHKLVPCAVDSLQVNRVNGIFFDLPTQEHDYIINGSVSCPFPSGPSRCNKIFAGKYEVGIVNEK